MITSGSGSLLDLSCFPDLRVLFVGLVEKGLTVRKIRSILLDSGYDLSSYSDYALIVEMRKVLKVKSPEIESPEIESPGREVLVRSDVSSV